MGRIAFGLLATLFWVVVWTTIMLAGCAQFVIPSYRHTGLTISGQYGESNYNQFPSEEPHTGSSGAGQWAIGLSLHFENTKTPEILEIEPRTGDIKGTHRDAGGVLEAPADSAGPTGITDTNDPVIDSPVTIQPVP